GTVAVGEVGLLGELRPVAGLERRLREAARLGFERAIVPAARRGAVEVAGIETITAGTLRAALGVGLVDAGGPARVDTAAIATAAAVRRAAGARGG
ncbi:MAG: hypothetical protein ACXWMX_05515, partial [Candidatus Limnocylindrales bacterium]